MPEVPNSTQFKSDGKVVYMLYSVSGPTFERMMAMQKQGGMPKPGGIKKRRLR